MKNYSGHFYLHRGNWMNLLYELMEMLQPCEDQKFSIWVPRDQTKNLCLIIVYGMPLADAYCYEKNIWQTSENVFHSFYLGYK